VPIIQNLTGIALSTTNDNILAGNQYEFAPFTGVVEVGLCQEASAGTLEVDITVGSELVCTRYRPAIISAFPVYPDHFIRFGVLKSDRIVIKVRETVGTQADLYWQVRFNRVG